MTALIEKNTTDSYRISDFLLQQKTIKCSDYPCIARVSVTSVSEINL